jgi:hypothetical protein
MAAPVDYTTLPLPAGWISEYDANQKAWYFVDTSKQPPVPTWEDPRRPSVPAAAATVASAAAPAQAPAAAVAAVAPSAVPAGVTGVAPGEAPLPAGWSRELSLSSKWVRLLILV